MVVESAWPAGTVRFRTGFTDLASVGMPLDLSYVDLTDNEAQLIRDHYAAQEGGSIPFPLPAVVFQGHATALTPDAIQWRYVAPPSETQKKNGRIDIQVSLESMAYVATE